ncbi:hypothetical protein CDL15_Pgr022003 [Punica granatum]|nr:hypothetical protein CDL15_Pgr022003 [Punica granatum]
MYVDLCKSFSWTCPKQLLPMTAPGRVLAVRYGRVRVSSELTLVHEFFILLGYLPTQTISLEKVLVSRLGWLHPKRMMSWQVCRPRIMKAQ